MGRIKDYDEFKKRTAAKKERSRSRRRSRSRGRDDYSQHVEGYAQRKAEEARQKASTDQMVNKDREEKYKEQMRKAREEREEAARKKKEDEEEQKRRKSGSGPAWRAELLDKLGVEEHAREKLFRLDDCEQDKILQDIPVKCQSPTGWVIKSAINALRARKEAALSGASEIECRFFAKGFCSRGDKCAYRHGPAGLPTNPLQPEFLQPKIVLPRNLEPIVPQPQFQNPFSTPNSLDPIAPFEPFAPFEPVEPLGLDPTGLAPTGLAPMGLDLQPQMFMPPGLDNYEAAEQTSAPSDLPQQIENPVVQQIYDMIAAQEPDRAADLPMLLSQFQGREQELYDMLHQQYFD